MASRVLWTAVWQQLFLLALLFAPAFFDYKAPLGRALRGSAAALSDMEELDASNGTVVLQDSNETSVVHFRDLIDPQTLQPYYLLVVTNCMQVVAQFMVFGFDVKVKEGESNCFVKALVGIGRPLGVFVFIAMALVTIRSDIAEFSAASAKTTGWVQTVLMFLVVWVTSPNYRAAKALFSSLDIQSPPVIFNERAPPAFKLPGGPEFPPSRLPELKIRYAEVPYLKVPLFPWSAAWFPWYKYLYMVILMPYIIPESLSQIFMVCVLYAPSRCCVTCCLEWLLFAHTCCCCWWLFLVVLTLGLWARAKDSLSEHWGYAWPPLVVVLIEIWALVVPIIFSWIYAGLMMCKDMTLADAEAFGRGINDPEALALGCLKLRDLQDPEEMKKDFVNWEHQGHKAPQDSKETEEEQKKRIGIEVVKVTIVWSVLIYMAIVPLQQMIVIAVARIANNDSSMEGSIKAIRDTVCERTIAQYTSYLRANIASAQTTVADKVSMVWGLL